MGSPTFGIGSHGTVISRSIDPNWPDNDPQGGAVDFEEIAELMDITPPALSRNTIETTNQNSDDDRYIPGGVRRHGECTFNVNFLPTDPTHDHLTGLQQSWFEGNRDIFRIDYPDGSAWLFSGFVTNIGPSTPVDDRFAADVTIRPTGKHDWAVPV